MLRVGYYYVRVSTNNQLTLAMQNRAMREYASRRGANQSADNNPLHHPPEQSP